MNKPNGISDKVWEMAGECYSDLPIVYDGWDETAVISCIALAISKAIEDEREETQQVLDVAHTALNDWLHVYASDMCQTQQVQDSHKRIWEAGGTMFYVAKVTEAIRSRSKGEE